MSNTVADAIAAATDELTKAGIEDAAREARILVSEASGIPLGRLTLSLREKMDAGDIVLVFKFMEHRCARMPMSHITLRRQFFKHKFHVGRGVLDPRPETETLVVHALSGPFQRVLDLGTGSGVILLSLLAERGAAHGVGTDISDDALVYARGNAKRLGVADRCRLVQSDWFSAVEGRFDLIVSNPPYIAAEEMAGLAPELAYEPRIALTDEGDGLSAYRAITAGAGGHLVPGGRLMVEIGWQQAGAVTALFGAAGFTDVTVLQDLDGRDRVVSGVLR